ncbi:MAG: hypothetical protein EZS28_011888 [Streblomastix strix]|uniref:Uncharacterized protein n=1 Tax=Streblomastix strix TaxID=222440 RepID=A0A5J4WCF6_9EUKA|nr:MAG: hypothetical protein EZS28_011888 [Streblomastix strix]
MFFHPLFLVQYLEYHTIRAEDLQPFHLAASRLFERIDILSYLIRQDFITDSALNHLTVVNTVQDDPFFGTQPLC